MEFLRKEQNRLIRYSGGYLCFAPVILNYFLALLCVYVVGAVFRAVLFVITP